MNHGIAITLIVCGSAFAGAVLGWALHSVFAWSRPAEHPQAEEVRRRQRYDSLSQSLNHRQQHLP